MFHAIEGRLYGFVGSETEGRCSHPSVSPEPGTPEPCTEHIDRGVCKTMFGRTRGKVSARADHQIMWTASYLTDE